MSSNLKAASLVLLNLSFTLVPGASAHGFGKSAEQEAGNYKVEFESEVLEAVSGEATPYVFRLLDKESGVGAPFETMFLRVEDKETRTVVFASPIASDKLIEGAARATLTLNEGNYVFNLSFRQGGEELAAVGFNEVVAAGEKSGNNDYKWYLGLAVSLILGAVFGYVFARKK